VTPYCPRHDFRPFTILLTFEYFLDCLKNQGIISLNCSISLRVVYRCEGNLRPDLVAKILEHDTVKILGVVDCDLLWDSISTDDVLPKEFLDGCGGYVGNGLRFNPLCELLHCYNCESVISLCW
jgi:hypothetical protein